ncbi:hypothetical protein BRPE64_ACDS20560 [Caballeronia insecticola]|uniref:Uncharacterized protein n=1 Tax=Caballeronia insecticola TaxID=758793 RepID=R4WS94_9BURK|nr:hypothetical protein BRPE64_ACDS20560 [Caballeronia insecticola]
MRGWGGWGDAGCSARDVEEVETIRSDTQRYSTILGNTRRYATTCGSPCAMARPARRRGSITDALRPDGPYEPYDRARPATSNAVVT